MPRSTAILLAAGRQIGGRRSILMNASMSAAHRFGRRPCALCPMSVSCSPAAVARRTASNSLRLRAHALRRRAPA